MVRLIGVLLIGIVFGITLIKGELASWFRINQMFRFEDPYMYLVIGSAVVVGGISYFIIRRLGLKDLDGEPIKAAQKPYHKGLIFGGTIFGMGWAITGACPGPIYAQFGAGTLLAVVSFAGALAGMYLFAFLQPRLPD